MSKLQSRNFRTVLDWCLLYVPFLLAFVCFAVCVVLEVSHTDLSHEMRGEIYHKFGAAVFCTSIFLSVLYGRKYALKPLAAIVCTSVCFYPVFNVATALIRDIEVALFGAGSIATFRSAVFLLPVCFLLARLFKKETLQLCDYLTPYFFFAHGVVTLACWVEGCCAGRSLGWGLLNPFTGQKAFPLQPLIVILAAGVAFWGLIYARNKEYKANGKVFAYSLVMYGIGRYILEFMSDDKRILGAMSWNSVCCIVMIAVGNLLGYFIYKQNMIGLERYNETEKM